MLVVLIVKEPLTADYRQGDRQINVMLNELVGKVETLRLRSGKQRHVHMFLRNEIVNYHN